MKWILGIYTKKVNEIRNFLIHVNIQFQWPQASLNPKSFASTAITNVIISEYYDYMAIISLQPIFFLKTTAWKVSKYEVFSSLYVSTFGLNA